MLLNQLLSWVNDNYYPIGKLWKTVQNLKLRIIPDKKVESGMGIFISTLTSHWLQVTLVPVQALLACGTYKHSVFWKPEGSAPTKMPVLPLKVKLMYGKGSKRTGWSTESVCSSYLILLYNHLCIHLPDIALYQSPFTSNFPIR